MDTFGAAFGWAQQWMMAVIFGTANRLIAALRTEALLYMVAALQTQQAHVVSFGQLQPIGINAGAKLAAIFRFMLGRLAHATRKLAIGTGPGTTTTTSRHT